MNLSYFVAFLKGKNQLKWTKEVASTILYVQFASFTSSGKRFFRLLY